MASCGRVEIAPFPSAPGTAMSMGVPFTDLTTVKRHIPPVVDRTGADLLSSGGPLIPLMTIPVVLTTRGAR
jgi:hypothetical protein